MPLTLANKQTCRHSDMLLTVVGGVRFVVTSWYRRLDHSLNRCFRHSSNTIRTSTRIRTKIPYELISKSKKMLQLTRW